MPSTGIRRKVDDLGRIVIPAGIRRSLDINEGDALEVAVDGDKVVLAKPSDRCVFCAGEDDLSPFRSRMVCRPCVAALGVLGGDGDRDDAPPDPAPATAPSHERPTPTPTPGPVPAAQGSPDRGYPAVRDLRPAPAPDERVAGVRDERRSAYDPASSTAW
jgi:transcriptional pleiotropic regulator of transition state genes